MKEQDWYLLVLLSPIVIGAVAWFLLGLIAALRDARKGKK